MLKPLIFCELQFLWGKTSTKLAFIMMAVMGVMVAKLGDGLLGLMFSRWYLHPFNLIYVIASLGIPFFLIISMTMGTLGYKDFQHKSDELVNSMMGGRRQIHLARVLSIWIVSVLGLASSILIYYLALQFEDIDPAGMFPVDFGAIALGFIGISSINLLAYSILIYLIYYFIRSGASAFSLLCFIWFFALIIGNLVADENLAYVDLFTTKSLGLVIEELRSSESSYWEVLSHPDFLVNRLLLILIGGGALIVIIAMPQTVSRFLSKISGVAKVAKAEKRNKEFPSVKLKDPVKKEVVPFVYHSNISVTQLKALFFANFKFVFMSWSLLLFVAVFTLILVFELTGQQSGLGENLLPTISTFYDVLQGKLYLVVVLYISYISSEIIERENAPGLVDLYRSLPIKSWPKILSYSSVPLLVGVLIYLVAICLGFLYVNGTHEQWMVIVVPLFLLWFSGVFIANALTILISLSVPNTRAISLIAVSLLFVLAKYTEGTFIPGFAPIYLINDVALLSPFLEQIAVCVSAGSILCLLVLLLARYSADDDKIGITIGANRSYIRVAIVIGMLIFVTAGMKINRENFIESNENTRHSIAQEYLDKFHDYTKNAPLQVEATKVLIYPDFKNDNVTLQVNYEAKNVTSTPIGSVFFDYMQNHTLKVNNETNFENLWLDEHLGAGVLTLKKPLAPNQKISVSFEIRYQEKNSLLYTQHSGQISSNNLFLQLSDIMPKFYFNKRKIDILEKDIPIKTQEYAKNPVAYEISIDVPEEMHSIVPGELVKESIITKGAQREKELLRRTYRTVMFAQQGIAILVAPLKEWSFRHNNVNVKILMQNSHDQNIKLMEKIIKRSLDFFNERYGKYLYDEMIIAELPRYLPMSISMERIIFLSPDHGTLTDYSSHLGIPALEAVLVHEIAHKWWGINKAIVPESGFAFIGESLTQFATLDYLQHYYKNRTEIVNYINSTVTKYLERRSSARLEDEEPPLLSDRLVPYVHYLKGLVTFYQFGLIVGEERLSEVIAEHYRVTMELSGRALINQLKKQFPHQKEKVNQLFETTDIFSLSINDVKAIQENGLWQLSIKIEGSVLVNTNEYEQVNNKLFNGDIELVVNVEKGSNLERLERIIKIENGHGEARFSFRQKPVLVELDTSNKFINARRSNNYKYVEYSRWSK